MFYFGVTIKKIMRKPKTTQSFWVMLTVSKWTHTRLHCLCETVWQYNYYSCKVHIAQICSLLAFAVVTVLFTLPNLDYDCCNLICRLEALQRLKPTEILCHEPNIQTWLCHLSRSVLECSLWLLAYSFLTLLFICIAKFLETFIVSHYFN